MSQEIKLSPILSKNAVCTAAILGSPSSGIAARTGLAFTTTAGLAEPDDCNDRVLADAAEVPKAAKANVMVVADIRATMRRGMVAICSFGYPDS